MLSHSRAWGPQGTRGTQGPKGDTGDRGAQGTPAVLRECHLNRGYPSACYNATEGILTLTGIDLADVGDSGTDDDIDVSKISIAGKGGTDDALTLSAAPTIAKVDDSEFTLTLAVADRGDILERLDRNGTIASDSMNFFIALENNWNGSSSSAISMPVLTTNFPPGYCGSFSGPTVERSVAYEFFGGGTGAMDSPLLITMRRYCNELYYTWGVNYPSVEGLGSVVHKNIALTMAGDYVVTLELRSPQPSGRTAHFFIAEELGIDLGGFLPLHPRQL